MRNFIYVFIFLGTISSKTSAQSLKELLELTQRNLLTNLPTQSKHNVVITSKNYLDTKFSVDTFNYYVSSLNNEFLLKEVSSKVKKILFYQNTDGYHVYISEGKILANNKKFNNLDRRLQHLPFFNDKSLFLQLLQNVKSEYSDKFTSNKVNIFITQYKNTQYQIAITDSGIIKSLKVTNYSKEYGTEYKQFYYSSIQLEDSIHLLNELNFYKNNFEWTSLKKMEKETKYKYQQFLSSDSLVDILKIDTTKYSYVFIDFFYRTCLPCIKAIPEINKINEINKILVIGVDPIDKDEGDWSEFIKRYNITYKIIDGSIAKKVKEIIIGKYNIGYPTTVLFEISNGKILVFEEGFSKNLYRDVQKAIQIKIAN